MKNGVFDLKVPNSEKLVRYGFSNNGDLYTYKKRIMDGRFEMSVDIRAADGGVTTEVVDLCTGDPYTLHLIAEADGAFIGAVRAEYGCVLKEIADNCFERDVFKSDIAHKVIKYVSDKYGDELQYLWKNFPTNAVWRRKDNGKWYGALLVLSKRKLGFDSDEVVEIIDLRIDPDVLPSLVDGSRYFAGYHMNKKNWFTMCLDGSVTAEEVCGWIDKSYEIAAKG